MKRNIEGCSLVGGVVVAGGPFPIPFSNAPGRDLLEFLGLGSLRG